MSASPKLSFPRMRESIRSFRIVDSCPPRRASFGGSDRKFLLILLLFFNTGIFAQTDWERWGKADPSYLIKTENYEDETKLESPGLTAGALSLLRKAYAFFISDLDGDNCPFYPSCSNFYVQSVKEAGIFKGTLMFADRFTRDMNILKSETHYPRHTSGRFYDQPRNYTLWEDKIVYYPPETTLKK